MTELHPQTNQFSQSNISQRETTSDFQQETPQKSGLPRWIIILIIAGGIVLIGAIGYGLYQKILSPSPSFPDEATKVEESVPGKLPLSETTPESPPATKITDCGNTQFNLLDQTLNPEDNSTLVCLGNHFLNNCQEAIAVVNGNEIIIKGGNLTECKIALPTAEELIVNVNEVKGLAQEDNKKPEEYPGTITATILVIKAFESISTQDLSAGETGNIDTRIKFTELLDNNFITYTESNLALFPNEGLENLGHCQHDLYTLEDECDLFFTNSERNKTFDLDIEKVNYQMADKNNFDLDKAISRAKERFNYLHDLNLTTHKTSSRTLSLQYIDEYKFYMELFGLKDVLIRKGSWIIKVSYSQEIEDQKIVNIVNYLTNKM